MSGSRSLEAAALLEAFAFWGTACNLSEPWLPHPGASEVSERSPGSLLEFCLQGTPASHPLCEKTSGSHSPTCLPSSLPEAYGVPGAPPREQTEGERGWAEGSDQLPEARPRAQGSQEGTVEAVGPDGAHRASVTPTQGPGMEILRPQAAPPSCQEASWGQLVPRKRSAEPQPGGTGATS